jgi:hypothetical protein
MNLPSSLVKYPKELVRELCENREKIVGVVYKVTVPVTRKFFIGSTLRPIEFLQGRYSGSGSSWNKYLRENEINRQTLLREILYVEYHSREQLHNEETRFVKLYCDKTNGIYEVDQTTGCLNDKTFSVIEECICPECHSLAGLHKKTCSRHNKICPECGEKGGHARTCSRLDFKNIFVTEIKLAKGLITIQSGETTICEYCGGIDGRHKTGCVNPLNNKKPPCPECGSRGMTHKKTCSQYKDKICPECGGHNGKHNGTCSKYKPRPVCSECGGIGRHKKDCHKRMFDL